MAINPTCLLEQQLPLKSCTMKKNYLKPYPYISPPKNKPTKTGYRMSTTPTINIYYNSFI